MRTISTAISKKREVVLKLPAATFKQEFSSEDECDHHYHKLKVIVIHCRNKEIKYKKRVAPVGV